MRLVFRMFFCVCVLVGAASANDAALVARYDAALKLPQVFEILRNEGTASALELAETDGSISPSPAWSSRVASIYSVEKMRAAFEDGLRRGNSLAASEPALAFFETDLGRRIVELELAARTALSDEEIAEATKDRARDLSETMPGRRDMYEAFIRVNNLVDSNVMGALNSNLAFYRGLGSNPSFNSMDERTILSSVYEQAGEIREEMEDWTMNFSVLAYELLTDKEMEDYIALSETPAGQHLNKALFSAFDVVFEMHSFELGRAMAEFMQGDDT